MTRTSGVRARRAHPRDAVLDLGLESRDSGDDRRFDEPGDEGRTTTHV
jgi:hypothetical protein